MLAETGDMHWDFICFSETRAEDDDVLLEGGHRLLCCNKRNRYAGVAILVHSQWVRHILCFRQVSDRVAYIDVSIGNVLCRIIAVYVPHAGYPTVDFDACFDDIRVAVLDARRQNINAIVAGDFNTEVDRGWRSCRLAELMQESGLQFGVDFETLNLDDKWTFRSCLGACRILDYIWVSERLTVVMEKLSTTWTWDPITVRYELA